MPNRVRGDLGEGAEGKAPDALNRYKGALIKTLFAILLVGLAGLSLFFIRDSVPQKADQEVEEELLETPSHFFADGYFVSNEHNIRFELPVGWDIADTASFTFFPEGIEKPVFSFQKEGTSCVVAYALIPDEVREELEQVSFADRIYGWDWQLYGSWFVAKDPLGEDLPFYGDSRQYLDRELRIAGVFRRGPRAFILFNSDGGSVPDDCNSDMNELLETLEYYYEPVSLDDSSRGTLWVVSEFSNEEERSARLILFTPEGSSDNYEVMSFPREVVDPQRQLLVFDNKLYFNANRFPEGYTGDPQTAVAFADPFLGVSETLPGTKISGAYISSSYIHDGEIYSLVGDKDLVSCLDGPSECRADLYKTSLYGGEPQLLIENVLGGYIMGYKEDEEALYLADGWGDAGCFSSRYSRYVGGEEELIGRYSSCYGDEDHNAVIFATDAITESAKRDTVSSRAAKVKDGRISPQPDVPEQLEDRDSYTTFLFSN